MLGMARARAAAAAKVSCRRASSVAGGRAGVGFSPMVGLVKQLPAGQVGSWVRSLSSNTPAGKGEQFEEEPFGLVYVWFFASTAIILFFTYRFVFGVAGDYPSLRRSVNRGLELQALGTQLSEDAAKEKLPAALPRVFMDVATSRGSPIGRLTFVLRSDVAPKTAENFRQLCTCEKGDDKCYKGSPFHRVIPDFMAQGGDFTAGDGTGGASIYGEKFADEDFSLKHSREGVLSMANSGPDSNGSQFFLTFRATPWLDGKHVVFGELEDGEETLWKLEGYGTKGGKPARRLVVADCGQVPPAVDGEARE